MDAANVIALVVSVLALLAAAWSAVESWRLRQIEKGRDERQDLREKQEQARQVAAWMCVAARINDEFGAPPTRRWFLAVENSSQVPVYGARATVASKYPVPDLTAAMLPPGRTYFELSKNEWGYGVQADELDVVPRPLTNAERFRVTGFTFTDAAGDRWSRDHQGRLSATSGKESEATD